MARLRHRPHHLAPTLDTARVLLVYKDFQGRGFSHAGLGVTAMCTAKSLRREGIWADVWACGDAEDLRRRVALACAQAELRNELPVTHVVIAAPWIATHALAKLATDFPDIVWTVVCHSGVGFLARRLRSHSPHARGGRAAAPRSQRSRGGEQRTLRSLGEPDLEHSACTCAEHLRPQRVGFSAPPAMGR